MKNVFLFTASLSLSFLIFEGLANILDITPRPLEALDLKSYQVSSDSIIRYEYRPDYLPDQQPYDGSHSGFKINSIGFRDIERNEKKDENVKRILLLGDSTTAGNGISDFNKIYSSILENSLNSENNNTKYEVLNMAVGGYHTMQEAQTLKLKGLRFKPDLVIIVLCLNDFSLNADGGVFQRLKDIYQNKVTSADLDLSSSFIKRSRLAFALYHHFALSNNLNWEDSWYQNNALKGKNPVEAGFELISELQKEHKFKAMVLILPEFKNNYSEYQRYQDHENVKRIAKKFPSFAVVDLVKKFSKYDNNLRNYSYDTCHMNENGHKVMAQILNPIVKKILPSQFLVANL